MIQTGLENLIENPPAWLFGKRLGLLCNPASTDREFRHARILINERFPGQLKVLYSPQHGFFGEKQDNMVESAHLTDPMLGIPVFSLYGKTRIPAKKMFEPMDVLLCDLQDAGTRVYTFVYTLSYCMEAAKRFGKTVVVLDRPNPLGGMIVEGNLLSPEYASFVGRYPIPMRHGLTIGELARMFNDRFGIGCELEVIPMKLWCRDMMYSDTGLPWIAPSPNLPSPVSALVYPGQVLWEGTNVSEGRGTTQPFEIFGAPFMDTEKMLSFLGGNRLPGIILRPLAFEPTSNKWQRKLCRGFQIHITDLKEYKPYMTTLKLLQAVLYHHSKEFEWKQPPYEYEFEKLPIDLLIGDPKIRQHIELFENIEDIERAWQKELDEYDAIRRKYEIYRQGELSQYAICIYTDGACSGNPGPAGIGVFIRFKGHEKEISEYIGPATNNIAELKAIQIGLLSVKDRSVPVRLFTDSGYAYGLLVDDWKAKANTELVESVRKLIKQFRDLKLVKVEGHAGNAGNERADKLATEAVRKARV
jgi:uncharacterized protein YbbC (DUF1343 family)/ribonuclease HI